MRVVPLDCLVCWNTLCDSNSQLPQTIDDICPDPCVDFIPNHNFGQISADPQCCSQAANYSTNVTTSFVSDSANQEQCQPSEYNPVPNPFSIDDYETEFVAQRQYFLYSDVQFNCTGCIKNISIDSRQAVTQETSLIQIWSTKTDPVDNQTVLVLRRQMTFDLVAADSVETGVNLFRTSKELPTGNESFCFEASDVFGIMMTTSFQVYIKKDSSNSKIYSREGQNCDSLKEVYYLDDDDLVSHGPPLIVVSVTEPVASGEK